MKPESKYLVRKPKAAAAAQPTGSLDGGNINEKDGGNPQDSGNPDPRKQGSKESADPMLEMKPGCTEGTNKEAASEPSFRQRSRSPRTRRADSQETLVLGSSCYVSSSGSE
eukprot:s8046_g1.t1